MWWGLEYIKCYEASYSILTFSMCVSRFVIGNVRAHIKANDVCRIDRNTSRNYIIPVVSTPKNSFYSFILFCMSHVRIKTICSLSTLNYQFSVPVRVILLLERQLIV